MELESLMELYVEQLATLVDAERQILAVLPRMIDAATATELRDRFSDQQARTRTHIRRLDEIVAQLEHRPRPKTCNAMKALIDEVDDVIHSRGDPSVRDAGLICAMQRLSHYQIALYGCTRTFADLLVSTEAADSLVESLDDHERADKKLTYLAKGLINIQAAEA